MTSLPSAGLDLARANERLEGETPEARLAFAAEHYGADLLFTSSFGAQSAVLLHLWSVVCPQLPVVFIDTGFLFPETLAYRDRLASRLGLAVKVLVPDVTHDEFLATYPADIQRTDPDFCCSLNKVAPLAPLREAARAWVSGLRRDQSAERANTAILEQEGALVRVHPIATLTARDVKAYLARHDLPEHPLVARRFLSIGCAPCTRPVRDGEEERAGRWGGLAKTECGLHPARGAAPASGR
ncbi:MAG: phosphoadenylyl-sulfate reductase [Labilithrix sp.]|nr:phosphoadenylyl-sulfate reductase [Labilithrix sp.]